MDKEKIFPKDILDKMPKLGATGDTPSEEVKVHIKLFNPYGYGTWYLTEYDPVSRVFYGLVTIMETEFGTVGQDELLELKLPFGGTIERDLFLPDDFTLAQAMEREEALRSG